MSTWAEEYLFCSVATSAPASFIVQGREVRKARPSSAPTFSPSGSTQRILHAHAHSPFTPLLIGLSYPSPLADVEALSELSQARQHAATPPARRVTACHGPMRLRTLNGAPLRANLDFSPAALLHPNAAARFLQPNLLASDPADGVPFKWRHILPTEQRLRSDWSQPYLPNGGFQGSDPDICFFVPGVGASFDAIPDDTTNLDTVISVDEAPIKDSDFVHQSLLFHDTLLSSQIAPGGVVDDTVTSQSFIDTSFDSTTSADMDRFQHSNIDLPILQVPVTLKLTALGALPSAAHLSRICPQTPTRNMLCVLAAPPEDREVFVKKGGYKMRLREIVVADDTRSDFKITFWQKPSRGSDTQNVLSHTLQRMKAGDILLLRNIALNTFRGNVYGQSLNPFISRVQTSIEILKNNGGISSRQLAALPAPVVATFIRVKKWATAHVASDFTGRNKRKDEMQRSARSVKRSFRSSNAYDDPLPPDTMESH